jgi:predicted nuclease of predicted toxin-antitoxin system
MTLLFDQNMSFRPPALLSADYPSAEHIRNVGLAGADDQDVWDYALPRGLIIVSKDSDFQHRALLYGRLQRLSGFGPAIVRQEPSRNSCARESLMC